MASSDSILKVSILGKDSIHAGFHLTDYIARTVTSTLPSSTYVLITDTNIAPLHLPQFTSAFQAVLPNGARFLTQVISPGETSKSREGKALIEDFLLLNACVRDTVILAMGGGVIGDLVGFVAATFMRGVKFVQIPTTLLAMVDSSVGGKTAIDTPHGKNLIGAFWQPEYIFIDAAFLSTLPPREFSNGMAEVVKTAAIWNEEEFARLEDKSVEIWSAIQQTQATKGASAGDGKLSEAQETLLKTIVGSISVKAYIVTKDERETGLRNLVNFGHTIGHAIEAVLTPTILHGECVSVGMILEAEIARQMGVLSQVAVGRLTRVLKAYNLPISLSDPRISRLEEARGLGVQRLLDIMKVDKKNAGSQKKIVILSRIGKTYEEKATNVSDEIIAKTLSEAVVVTSGTPKHHPVRMSTPGSKSISNRALVLAALAKGTCRLKNLLHSDDTQVMMAALQDLKGASFEWEDGGETLVVKGGEGKLAVPPKGKEVYLGNAGTAARFLTTVCTLVSSSPDDERTVITGNARMKQRPIGPLVDSLRSNGSDIDYLESEGCLPLRIKPAGLKGGNIELAASVSSQYVSSILLCAPYAQEPITLSLVGGQVISQPYIDMTIAMMKTFGITVTRRKDEAGKELDVYDVPRGCYVNPDVYAVESDASSATYPLAVAAITGTTCTIQNIGSASLQGDAQFAVRILRPMGCEVVQTETETTVTGPSKGGLKGLGEVDMEVMTDAFLTATVLAAVASGKTKIYGIANQRVKECNRIRAMMDQLAKFGVETSEHDDGLIITGKKIEELKRGASVHCYDDHRVAMAFSVLGTVIEGTILEEKRCVEKTWPNWWDDLENKIGLEVKGVELDHSSASTSKSPSTSSPATDDKSIILIGMRGSGKTFLGQTISSALSWPLIDADAYLESTFTDPSTPTIREYVQKQGWETFRAAELKVFEELLSKFPKGHILSLGGGIVETPKARELLKEWVDKKGGKVVYVKRRIEEIVEYLGSETARPAYGESIESVFERRKAWFEDCSNYEFYNTFSVSSPAIDNAHDSVAARIKETRDEVRRFFGHITGRLPNFVDVVGRRSYFLSLTFPDLSPALKDMEELTAGADAIELRADLLQPCTEDYVSDQLALLRRATTLPIVFTVRTKSQGGAFPDDQPDAALRLLKHAIKNAVEYVDVEITLPEKSIAELVKNKGSSQIIASWHDWSGNMAWDGADVKAKYAQAAKFGDIVKVIGSAKTLSDNVKLYQFVEERREKEKRPLLAINMGVVGQMSRVLNEVLTPITHPLLPFKAAPGQLSFKQIQEALHLLGQLPSKKFYIFGTPIGHSMSPTLHNTGFEALGLPHEYALFETQTVNEDIKKLIKQADFGGASVTIPFKLDIIPLLDSLSPAAKAIGAVNTVIPQPDGTLHGDNTDWIGIRESIVAHVPIGSIHAGLVLGAGGTARAAIYALHYLKAKTVYLYNRTKSKAEELQKAFPDVNIVVLDSLSGQYEAPNVIVSTVPATSTSATTTETKALSIPANVFAYQNGSACVVDMAYKPALTPLLQLSKDYKDWNAVPGLQVLLEQGYRQFELWTGRRCPKGVVSKKVWEKYNA